MEENFEEEKPRLTKRQLKRIQAVEQIQATALEAPEANRVSKSLTFQQGLSILLRSQQLIAEGEGINPAEKAKQIDYCWRIRRGR